MNRKHALIAALAACLPLAAQRNASYDFSVVPQARIDLRDLGYPPLDLIPPGESAIRALAVAPDGKLYGATSGERAHLFVFDPRHGYVTPLGRLPGKTVHHSVAVSPQGDVYIGTSLDVDNNGEGYANYPGGHLLKYSPATERRREAIQIDKDCPVQDLGAPVKGQGIYALVAHPDNPSVYGLTYPDGEFFSLNTKTGEFKSHGSVAKAKMPGEKFENEKNIGRALVVAKGGVIYTSGGGSFYSFGGAGEVQEMNLRVPTVPGREVYSRVDAWAQDEGGNIYGGSSDGYLFRFDPERNRVQNLGKPLSQYRIRGLVAAPNGKLYGIGGDNDDMARLFSYDPSTGGYEMLGMIDVNRRPYYAWQGYVFDAMAIGKDGTVFMGQAERKSKLYLFYPN